MQELRELDWALAEMRRRVQDEREQVLAMRRQSREVSAWAGRRRDSVRAVVVDSRERWRGPEGPCTPPDLLFARAVMMEAFEEARAVGYAPGSAQMLWLQRAENLLTRAQHRYRTRR